MNTLKNTLIILCAILGSCTLFSPATHFGSVVMAHFAGVLLTDEVAVRFGMFCGVASVLATSMLGFNAWSNILSAPCHTRADIFKKIVFYIGGVITAAPLMVDTFIVNQTQLNLTQNLMFTIFPGIFMSGVYGYSIEFLYHEFKNTKTRAASGIRDFKRSFALGVGILLGSISAIGCYWESLNFITPFSHSLFVSYFLSLLPVIFRAPLFIVSVYNVTYKITQAKTTQSIGYLSLLISLTLFSLFTIGGYSDITYNGMTESTLYQTSFLFRTFCYPLVLSTAMLCMLALNVDALITALKRAQQS